MAQQQQEVLPPVLEELWAAYQGLKEAEQRAWDYFSKLGWLANQVYALWEVTAGAIEVPDSTPDGPKDTAGSVPG